MISYFQGLNWNLLTSPVWYELVRACCGSMDATFPDIKAVRDFYLPWLHPLDYAASRGLFKLPGETEENYKNRIIDAYAFWRLAHSPKHLELLLDGQVVEHDADIWAEFSFQFNSEITHEEIEAFAQFLHEIKPARSRLKGVINVSNYLVGKEHQHTGGDDGALISHESLLDKGTLTHAMIEKEIEDKYIFAAKMRPQMKQKAADITSTTLEPVPLFSFYIDNQTNMPYSTDNYDYPNTEQYLFEGMAKILMTHNSGSGDYLAKLMIVSYVYNNAGLLSGDVNAPLWTSWVKDTVQREVVMPIQYGMSLTTGAP